MIISETRSATWLEDCIAALSKYTMPRTFTRNGVILWTDGHICLPAKEMPAKDLPEIGTLWDKCVARADDLLTPGKIDYRHMQHARPQIFRARAR